MFRSKRADRVRIVWWDGSGGLRQDGSLAVMVGKAAVFVLSFPHGLPAPDLPDDVETLKAMILAMASEQAANEAQLAAATAEVARLMAVERSANERIANLTSIVKVLERAHYGKRSERLRLSINDEQASFAFEEVETGLSAI
ncbi:hypothetical protein NKH02_33020 [Mesorhizobium sp. M1396]